MALEHKAAFSIGDTSGSEYIEPARVTAKSLKPVSQDLTIAGVLPAAAAAADAAAALLTAALASLAAAELYCNRCRFDSTSSRSAAQVEFERGSKILGNANSQRDIHKSERIATSELLWYRQHEGGACLAT